LPGYDVVKKEVFYTLNGQLLGVAFTNVDNFLCAAVRNIRLLLSPSSRC
jgi:hypothetical protein